MKPFLPYMQRGDRRAVLCALTLFVLAMVGFFVVGNRPTETPLTAADSLAAQALSAKPSAWSDGDFSRHGRARRYRDNPATYYDSGQTPVRELFAFDPNTADSTQLLRLGLHPRIVRNIYKYRQLGGVFCKSEDFAKLYGLTAGEFRTLKPYIHISSDYRPAAEVYATHTAEETSPITAPRLKKLQAGERIDLNQADTALMQRVPGIGPAFARAIDAYRQRLGGFVSAGQLLEIHDFPSDALPYFEVEQPVFRKLNVNRLSLAELRRHPYINFFQARAIVDYRRLKGPLHSLQDLSTHQDFTPEAISRLEPYVEF